MGHLSVLITVLYKVLIRTTWQPQMTPFEHYKATTVIH